MSEAKMSVPEFDPRVFHKNQSTFTLDDLAPYFGKHVAWSMDGTRILASGEDDNIVLQELLAAGIDPGQVVWAYVDDPSVSNI